MIKSLSKSSRIMIWFVIFLSFLNVVLCKKETKVQFKTLGPDSGEAQTKSDFGLFPANIRSLDDFSIADYLIISDIEGNLHNVDRNSGNVIWSLPFDEPLIRLETNSSSPKDESNILWFVEPFEDGTLYYFTSEFGMNKLPASIKDLVLGSPFSLTGDDKIYTGTRKTSLYTINIHTGEVVSQFGGDSDAISAGSADYKTAKKDSDTVMIGKTLYELTIHSKSNKNTVWYVTYSQWGHNNIDNDLMVQNQKSIDEVYFTPFHDKSLLAINRQLGTPTWISKLPALAVNVFDIFANKKAANNFVILPHPLQALNDLQINQELENGNKNINNNLCFVNKTAESGQWFAMSFRNYPTLIKSAPISQYQMTLFKLESGVIDYPMLYTLRHLRFNEPGADGLINGIHRFSELDYKSMYQPKSKFGDILSRHSIEESDLENYKDLGKETNGSKGNNDLIVHQTTANLIKPDIIDGLKFQKTSDDETFSPSSPEEKDYYLLETADASEHNLIDYYEDPYHVQETTTLSLIRKICEDIITILILTLLVLAIYKAKFVYRQVKGILNNWDIDINVKIDRKSRANAKSSDTLQVDLIEETISKSTENYGGDSLPEMEEATKKKRKRGTRGGRRGNKKKHDLFSDLEDEEFISDADSASHHSAFEGDKVIATKSLVKLANLSSKKSSKKLQIENDLTISDKILGYGSHGTVVYQGTFENRPVAVKRMLLDFYDVANHEVSLLQQSDDHPNVIRYFCSQTSVSEKFLYIALELCQGSLEDLVEKSKINPNFNKLREQLLKNVKYNDLLYQLANGLNYLHNLKIVHRDLKPQNILIGDYKNRRHANIESDLRLLISDFGLCKKLDHDQSSFRATSQNAASGTTGWRAPEILLNHDIYEISPETVTPIGSSASFGNGGSGQDSNSIGGGKRLTKAIDIFSLGCIFYYILTGGNHPFGDRFMREGNIIGGKYDLSLLKSSPDSVELTHLIESMIQANASLRPNTNKIMKHPYFWPINKKLQFLLKVSDRFEIERRDPPSPLLIELEKHSYAVTGGNWHKMFDSEFMNNLGKYRKYQPEKLMDILRAIRNKYHHFNDMPDSLKKKMSPLPIGFYNYFNSKFPNLLMEVYFIVEEHLKQEHIFEEFY